MRPRIKVCCISSIEEARLAIKYGTSALGLVGEMPSGPGVIDDWTILNISKAVPPPIATFLLTSETEVENIISHHSKTQTNTIQIVDKLTKGSYKNLKNALPAVKIVQVIHVRDESSINEAIEISQEVDTLLLDSGNPNLEVKTLGGTGKTHNWNISKKIVEKVNIPVFLAGGLNPENAKEAFETVKPFGLDLCSGIRTDGKLDEKKLADFMKNVLE